MANQNLVRDSPAAHFSGLSRMFRNFPLVISLAVRQYETQNYKQIQTSVQAQVDFILFDIRRKKNKKKNASHIFLEIETSELLDNAKHAFNIPSVARGGNS